MRSKSIHIRFAAIAYGVWLASVLVQPAFADNPRTWQFKTPMPTARTGVSAVALNGKVYVMGGIDGQGKVLRVVERYDPETDTWDTAPSLRTPRYNAAAIVYHGNIYILGGRDSLNLPIKKVDVFIATENDWDSFDNLNEEREGPGAAVLDDELYVMGGSNLGANILDSVEFLDASDERWEESTDWDLDVPRASFASVVIGEFAYSIGGYSSFGPIGLVQRYNEQQGATDLASLSPARGALGAAFLDNSIYAIGGRRSNNQVVNTVNRFLPDQNRWESAPSMNTARERFGAVAISDQIFVFGGNDNSGAVLNSVEAFANSIVPSPTDDLLVTDEDVEMSANVLVNDTDPAGGSLTITSFSQPQHGKVTQQNASTFLYEPDQNYFGDDRFTYTVRNTTGGTAQATVNITVQAVNDAPWFESAPVTGAAENAPYSYNLAAGDIEDDVLRYEAVETPAWLTLTDLQNGQAALEGTPGPEDLGEHAVIIALSDGTDRVEQSFTVTVVAGAPAEPTLLSPADRTLDASRTISLTWDGAGAASYDLRVSLNDAFTDLAFDLTGIVGTSYELQNLEADTDYFWQVRAVNAAGASEWSTTFTFHTINNIANDDELPERAFALLPNYPNPFREATTIEFELRATASESVRLDVFDVHGRRIVQLSAGFLPPGRHAVRWDGYDTSGRPAASGSYIVRLQHGQDQQTRPILLIR